jgi:proteasome lid subunit RPN8/RPN11
MRLFWRKNQDVQNGNPTLPAADPDLLARQEEEAFVASVLKKRQERETPSPREIRAVAEEPKEKRAVAGEPEEIEWSEQEDVYRPQRIRAAELMARLAVKPPSDLPRGTVVCFVRQSAFDRIQAHLRSDTRIELGGLLVGEAFYDAELEQHWVVVEEALPAYEGEGTAVTFTYTEATWQALSPRLQDLPTTWTLLGSYHSHPGMGVFLSSTDIETQRSVFFQDWQVALVIDPISRAVGFFCGAQGHRCAHWEVV